MPRIVKKRIDWRKGQSLDWSVFADGKARRLVRGEDFRGDAKTARNRAHNAARRQGMRARTVTEPTGDLLVQFFPVTGASGG